VVAAVAPVIAPVAGAIAPVAQVIAPVVAPLAPTTGTAPSATAAVAAVNAPAGSGEWVAQAPVASRAGSSGSAAPAATVVENAPDTAEPADGSTAATAPQWTSPSLVGPNAAAQLQTLARSLEPANLPITRAGDATATRTASGGGSIPGSPSGPSPCNAGGSAGSGGTGLSSGAWAALFASPYRCAPTHELRPIRLPTVIWRPTVFLALQERPG
jgi:hypothetical protein